MKKLLILLFSLLISINSYSHEDWKDFIEYANGTYYVNNQSYHRLGDHTYWWSMCDCEASNGAYMSYQIYNQGYISNSQNVMHKELIYVTFQESMGEGPGEIILGDNEWINDDNDSSMENVVRSVSIWASAKNMEHTDEHLRELLGD